MKPVWHSAVDLAASLLTQENVVAIPTETVYGLAGNMLSQKAVERIYSLKQRPLSNPLIVHVSGFDQLHEWVTNIPPALETLARTYWPGPLTLLLDKTRAVPDRITAGSQQVAVRVPSHPIALALLQQIDFPLVAPSANPFTRISPTTAEHVRTYFGEQLPFVLDGGPCAVGLESTIVGMQEGRVILYRQGAIGLTAIEELLQNKVERYAAQRGHTPTPGLSPRHYAPLTRTVLCERGDIQKIYSGHSAVIVFTTPVAGILPENQFILSPSGSLSEAGQQLYTLLHVLDKSGYENIICERLPSAGIGDAINDRLQRAATR